MTFILKQVSRIDVLDDQDMFTLDWDFYASQFLSASDFKDEKEMCLILVM